MKGEYSPEWSNLQEVCGSTPDSSYWCSWLLPLPPFYLSDNEHDRMFGYTVATNREYEQTTLEFLYDASTEITSALYSWTVGPMEKLYSSVAEGQYWSPPRKRQQQQGSEGSEQSLVVTTPVKSPHRTYSSMLFSLPDNDVAAHEDDKYLFQDSLHIRSPSLLPLSPSLRTSSPV
jgi:hypothetical protein